MQKRASRWTLGLLLYLAATGGRPALGLGEAESAISNRTPGAVTDAAARQVFERFRTLAGGWRGRSTQGWTDRVVIRVIAAGSVVVATSEFEAHPDETMMTMYHLDGDRMMLTHYCVAKNQPRLQATSVENGGKKVAFSFRDGTNLASRNQGHMDQVLFEFQDEDHFSSRWSFYKDGREDWMEEIRYERIR